MGTEPSGTLSAALEAASRGGASPHSKVMELWRRAPLFVTSSESFARRVEGDDDPDVLESSARARNTLATL